MMKIRFNKLLPIVLLFLYAITGLIPNFEAYDRIAPQWLYLSILNFFCFVYILNEFPRFQSIIGKIFKFKPFILLLGFIIWGLLSYLYAINQVEVMVKFYRWVNILFALVIISTLISELKNQMYFIITSIILSVILIVELYYSYSAYFQLIKYVEYDFSLANYLKGATANKNITSSSILIKIPFVFFIITHYKNLFIKILSAVLILFSSYLILLIGSRAGIIALILISFLTLTSLFIYYFKVKNKSFLFRSLIFIILPLFASILWFQLQTGSSNSASIVNRASTINIQDTSTNQRLNYYKYAINHVIENPIFGTGLGNWKIKSIDYDKENINQYIVPYHVHNDFLEFGAELGIIGFGLFLMIFLYSFKELMKKLIYKYQNVLIVQQSFIILLGGLIYLIDANLNFPHARLANQIPFVIILSLLFNLNNSDEKS